MYSQSIGFPSLSVMILQKAKPSAIFEKIVSNCLGLIRNACDSFICAPFWAKSQVSVAKA